MKKITFITNKICPFAERVWITLEEKKLDFDLKEVNLREKEPYFTENYHRALGHDQKSNGKVPILIDGDITLTQSDLVSYYLAEKYEQSGNNSLIPKDSLERFKMREFASRFNKVLSAFYGFIGFSQKTPEEQEKTIQKSEEVFAELNSAIKLPYAIGEEFTMADIMIYPFLARWPAVEQKVHRKRGK